MITRAILFIYFCLLVSNCATAVSISDINRIEEGKKLFLKDEKYIAALKFFTKDLQKVSEKHLKAEMAEDMYWIAECLFQLRNFEKLEEVLSISEVFMKREHDFVSYKKLMLTKSKYLIDIGKCKDAIQLLQKTENNKNDILFILDEKLIIADAYYRISEFNKCKNIYDFVIKNSTDSIQIAQAYNGIGSYYYMNSKFDSAKLYYNKAFKIKTPNKIFVLINLSIIDNKFGNYTDSEKKLQEALKISNQIYGEYHPKSAIIYGALASIYLIKDNLGKSYHYSVKERDILYKVYGKNSEKLIYPTLNFGKIYLINKNYKKAETEILNALELVKKYYNKNHNLYTQCIVKYAEILIEKKNYKVAESLLKEVIDIKKNKPDDFTSDVYLQLGNCFLAQKKYKEAVLNFNKANEMYIHFFGNKNIYSIDPLTELSNTFLQINNLPEALKYANLALNQTIDNNKIIFPYDHWECVLQILKCKKEIYKQHQTNKNYKEDIDLIKNTISEASKIKQTYYSNGSQMYYAEKMCELNKLGIYFLTHFYKKTDSYFSNNLLYFSENNKANLLRYKISTGASNELLPETEKNKLTILTDKLNYFISLNENVEPIQININDSILFYQNLHEIFTKNIEQKYPKVYSIKYGQKPISVQEIQNKIKENTTFLIYCNDGEKYYCLAISKHKIIYKICGEKQKIDAIIQNYQTKILEKILTEKPICYYQIFCCLKI